MDSEGNPDVVARDCRGMTNATFAFITNRISNDAVIEEAKGYIRFRREANQEEVRQTYRKILISKDVIIEGIT